LRQAVDKELLQVEVYLDPREFGLKSEFDDVLRETHWLLNMEKAIGVVVLLTLTLAAAYWLGYHQGSVPALNQTSSLKQTGLRFRAYRNDVSHFIRTGEVVTPKAPPAR
jgi:hypothetical protein